MKRINYKAELKRLGYKKTLNQFDKILLDVLASMTTVDSLLDISCSPTTAFLYCQKVAQKTNKWMPYYFVLRRLHCIMR